VESGRRHTPAVEKEIGFFKWEIGQEQKEIQERQARVDSIRASMTTQLLKGTSGVDVEHDAGWAAFEIRSEETKIQQAQDRMSRAQKAMQYLQGLPPCVPGTEHAAETPPPPPPGGVLVPGAPPGMIPPRRTGSPFYNTPYNTPFYNTPVKSVYYYNTPYNTPYYNSPWKRFSTILRTIRPLADQWSTWIMVSISA
jgi:hypothetical protein